MTETRITRMPDRPSGIVTFELVGRVSAAEGLELQDAVLEESRKGPNTVIFLDMLGVTELTPLGLSCIRKCHAEINAAGVTVLIGLPAELRRQYGEASFSGFRLAPDRRSAVALVGSALRK